MKKDIDQILRENGLVRAKSQRHMSEPAMAAEMAGADVDADGGGGADRVSDSELAAMGYTFMSNISQRPADANAPTIGQGKQKDHQDLVADAAAAFARAASRTASNSDSGAAEQPRRESSVKMVLTQPEAQSAAAADSQDAPPVAEPKVVGIDINTGKIKRRQG